MRRLIPSLTLALVVVVGARPVVAQEVGEAVTITGCLAQSDDGEMEFILQNGMIGEETIAEIDLIPAEGVNVAPHVGHTVSVTGVVVAETEDMANEPEDDEENDDMDDLHVRVDELGHVAPSCEGG
ncbi:MAG: hypothetical protein R3195_11425 [Gemmatimonadota bacterium]|nr:hypothetical protein [Gemmatimonadota bacterium]